MTYIPYKYKRKKKKPQFRTVDRITPQEGEELTGFIGEQEASPYEERFGKALRNNNQGFRFQEAVRVLTNEPGDAKQVDFSVGVLQTPVEVYGEIGHMSVADRQRDRWREILINEEMRRMNRPLLKVVWWYELETQEQADQTVRELLT